MKRDGTVAVIWEAMRSEKGDLEHRCETYARWTLPGVCPGDTDETSEQVASYVKIGPRLVNNLANKISNVLFPQAQPFFSVDLGMDMKKRIRQEAGDEVLADSATTVRKEADFIAKYAMSKMNILQYRPKAVEAAQHILVTGNTIIRRLSNEKRVVYGVKDFGVRRTIDGEPYEVVLRDPITFRELPPEAQDAIKERHNSARLYGDKTNPYEAEYTLFTHYAKGADDMWTAVQEVDGIRLPTTTRYTARDFPCVCLVWSLPRGYNYARGLVEEHAQVFHNLNITAEAISDITQAMANIKWIVSPASLLDVRELNNSPRGSYHAGEPDDIKALMLDKLQELMVLVQREERYELELSKAFLMQAGTVRDAERVTAYEIQLNALELEQAFGGLYSRLALSWQKIEADYLMSKVDAKSLTTQQVFEITITTGSESLSREGILQNFRMAMMDLQLLEKVPEDMRASINPSKVAAFLFGQRGVNFEEFLYTTAEMQERQQQAIKQEQQMMASQAAAQAAARPEETPQ